MALVGLLVEAIYVANQPIHHGTCHPTAWPALRARFETDRVDYLSVEVRPSDAQRGYVVFASAPFRCPPSPDLARVYGLEGDRSARLDGKTAAGMILGAAHVEGAILDSSDGWAKLIQFGS